MIHVRDGPAHNDGHVLCRGFSADLGEVGRYYVVSATVRMFGFRNFFTVIVVESAVVFARVDAKHHAQMSKWDKEECLKPLAELFLESARLAPARRGSAARYNSRRSVCVWLRSSKVT